MRWCLKSVLIILFVVYVGVVSTLDDFTRCNSKEEDSVGQVLNFQQQSRPTSWSPPPNGLVKVNWDASIHEEKWWIGLGVIARDGEGFCLGACNITK